MKQCFAEIRTNTRQRTVALLSREIGNIQIETKSALKHINYIQTFTNYTYNVRCQLVYYYFVS